MELPRSVMLEVDPRSLARNKVLAMRFWGYVGVQFCAILVPMLVFRLSGSPALAGAALFMEWLPKLGLYMAGGSLVQRYSSRRAHLALDLARLAAMAAMGASVAWSASVWIVAGAAAVYQCANAVSNILFERAVPRWWDAPEQAQGHAALMRSDQWACLAALCIGVLAKDPLYLALFGFGAQAMALGQAWRGRRIVYPDAEHKAGPEPKIWERLSVDARAAAKPRLLGLALAGSMIGVPCAAVFAMLPYFLEWSSAGSASDAGLFSVLLLARTAVSLAALWGMRGLLARKASLDAMASASLAVLGLSCAAVSARPGAMLFFALAIAMSASSVFFAPMQRALRQELIERLVPADSRSGATGILISVEACSYLGAAGLFSALGGDLAALSLAGAAIMAAGALLLAVVKRAALAESTKA